MTKETILEYLSNHKEEFKNDFNVNKIALFGSYARGEETKDSDIDILVDMQPSFKNFFNLKYLLEEKLNKKVDLGNINNLRAFIKNSIKKDIIYV